MALRSFIVLGLGLVLCLFVASIALLGLGETSVAFAQEALSPPSAQEGPGLTGLMAGISRLLPLFGIIFLIFYFLVLRPQEAKEREHQSLIESLNVGTWLVTTGGVIGKVAAVEDKTVILEVSNGIRVKFDKSSVVKEVEGEVASFGKSKGKRKSA